MFYSFHRARSKYTKVSIVFKHKKTQKKDFLMCFEQLDGI